MHPLWSVDKEVEMRHQLLRGILPPNDRLLGLCLVSLSRPTCDPRWRTGWSCLSRGSESLRAVWPLGRDGCHLVRATGFRFQPCTREGPSQASRVASTGMLERTCYTRTRRQLDECHGSLARGVIVASGSVSRDLAVVPVNHKYYPKPSYTQLGHME